MTALGGAVFTLGILSAQPLFIILGIWLAIIGVTESVRVERLRREAEAWRIADARGRRWAAQVRRAESERLDP